MEEHVLDIIVFVIFVVIAIGRLLKGAMDRLNMQNEERGAGGAGNYSGLADYRQAATGAQPYKQQQKQQKPPAPQPQSSAPPPPPPPPEEHETLRDTMRSEATARHKKTELDKIEKARKKQSRGGGRAFSKEVPTFTTPFQQNARTNIRLDLKNRRKLRLAMITREVIDRPRAFDV